MYTGLNSSWAEVAPEKYARLQQLAEEVRTAEAAYKALVAEVEADVAAAKWRDEKAKLLLDGWR